MGCATRALALGKLVEDGIIYGGDANGTPQKLLDAAGEMQGAKNRAPLLLRCACLFACRGGGHTPPGVGPLHGRNGKAAAATPKRFWGAAPRAAAMRISCAARAHAAASAACSDIRRVKEMQLKK